MEAKTGIWIAIIASLIVASGVFFGLRSYSTVSTEQNIPDESGKTISGRQDFCANNPNLNLNIRVQDVLANTISYTNATIYLQNLDTNTIVAKTVTTGADVSDFVALTDALQCGAVKGYKVYVKTTQDGMNAIEKVAEIVPDKLFADPVELTIQASKHSLIKVKAYNNDLKQNLANGLSTDYQNVAAVFNETGTSGTLLTIGTDGYLDVEFTIAPQSANEAAGRDAIVCANYADDSNANDWDGSSIDIAFEGAPLSEKSLNANDAIALSSYEICYSLARPVGKDASGAYDSVSLMSFYIKSQSGENPDFDPILRYVELGDYQSTKSPDTMLTGVAAQDNSARTMLGSATASTITLNIV